MTPGTVARTASKARRVGARHEQRLAARDDPLGDGGDLRRRLAEAENDLGESLAHGAMRIDAREAEILERRRAQRGQHERRSGRRVEVAAAHTIEQVLKFGAGHG